MYKQSWSWRYYSSAQTSKCLLQIRTNMQNDEQCLMGTKRAQALGAATLPPSNSVTSSDTASPILSESSVYSLWLSELVSSVLSNSKLLKSKYILTYAISTCWSLESVSAQTTTHQPPYLCLRPKPKPSYNKQHINCRVKALEHYKDF